MAISEQWPYLLEPGLRAIFFQQITALAAPSKIPVLFNVMNSKKAQEYFLSIGGMGDWEEYKGRIEYDDPDQGYRTVLTHREFAKGFKVARALMDDDLYSIINAKPASLALSATRTREKHAASVFNNAFSASYVGGDGVALCSDSHPLAPTHAGDTQDNKGTSPLSSAAVNAARLAMRSFTDDRGELITVTPDTLLVPPELEETAYEIVQTENKPNTADFVANFSRGFIKKVVVWDYLTDANNWFLIDGALAKQHLLWLDRVVMEFALDPASDFNLESKFRGYERHSYGWSDWKWVYGSEVA